MDNLKGGGNSENGNGEISPYVEKLQEFSRKKD